MAKMYKDSYCLPEIRLSKERALSDDGIARPRRVCVSVSGALAGLFRAFPAPKAPQSETRPSKFPFGWSQAAIGDGA
jgi:hypothetical protein